MTSRTEDPGGRSPFPRPAGNEFFRGDADIGGVGRITVDRTVDGLPVIRLTDPSVDSPNNGGGTLSIGIKGSNDSAERMFNGCRTLVLKAGDDTNIRFSPTWNEEDASLTIAINVYYK